MLDWLWAPIDAARAHEVGFAVSWHGRLMVLAWGVLAPLAVILARFFKILPGQNWPQELDSQVWWRGHWVGQLGVMGLSLGALALVLPVDMSAMGLHNWLGFAVLALMVVQALLGLFRGSKGGPTAPAKDGSLHGDHYDMTPWRQMFEACHKALGYLLLGMAALVILTGFWKANAPVWMWISTVLWWGALYWVSVTLQRRGLAVDTYQAIWGTDPDHPGNQGPAPGWGMRRLASEETKGQVHVRSD